METLTGSYSLHEKAHLAIVGDCLTDDRVRRPKGQKKSDHEGEQAVMPPITKTVGDPVVNKEVDSPNGNSQNQIYEVFHDPYAYITLTIL